mmetsp:Transcript_6001/g.10745  ORF Transcript_6001/g.10745 Transcript_6001/m.10745 type:complete len:90 (+) Transcript_6001:472-741(+)
MGLRPFVQKHAIAGRPKALDLPTSVLVCAHIAVARLQAAGPPDDTENLDPLIPRKLGRGPPSSNEGNKKPTMHRTEVLWVHSLLGTVFR